MSDFNETPGWYEVQNVAEIEDFDPDQYNNIWYNVKFQDNAETFMWLAKERPVEGQKYYGHFEPTKSGKRLRFKRDKEPEDEEKPAGTKPAYQPKQYQDNSKNITLGLVWKTLINIQGVPENDEQFAKFYETVNEHVTELIMIGEKLKESE